MPTVQPESGKLQRYTFIMPANPYIVKKLLLLLPAVFITCMAANAESPVLHLITDNHSEKPEGSFTDSTDTGTVGFYDERSAQNVVWESKLRRKVEFFCDTLCGGRATGTRGGTEAAFEIIRNFRRAGLERFGDSYSKPFYTSDSARTGHNIIGMLPGSVKRPVDSYIIIGAHYDHIGILGGRMFPGADNNASGLVAMLSLAEMFSSMKTLGKVYGSSIIFVAFDGKELSMSGAEALWKMLKDGSLTDPVTGKPVTQDKIRMMINIDQIGSSLSPLSSGRKDFIIMLGGHTLPEYYSDWLSLCNRFYGSDLEISESYYGSENFTRLFYRLSDQRPFVDHKVPAVLFTSGITLNNNKTYDSPATLDYPVFRRRIILIYHWTDKML